MHEHGFLYSLCTALTDILKREANIASLWSRMVVRPMRSLAAQVDSDVCICESLNIFSFWTSVWLRTNVGQIGEVTVFFFFCDLWPLGSAKRDLTSKEHWMLYYKLHVGCLVVFLGGFQAPKRQQKAQWDRFSFDNFYFVQKNRCNTNVLWRKTDIYKYIYVYILS